MPSSGRLPRRVHPVAWWLWAAGLVVAASRTDNPVLLVAVLAVVLVVVGTREDPHADAPLGMFLTLGAVAVTLRVVAGALLGGGVEGPTVLVTLPRLPLPEVVGSVRVGGPITLEGVLADARVGLQLATMLVAIGAASALSSPRRLLRHVPATLYDVGTALVVALSFAPRMVVDARAVRAGRRLRGHDGAGPRELARTVVPVLEASFDRSLDLAASMEARGYGRRTPMRRRWSGPVTLLGLVGLLSGTYGVLDGSAPVSQGWPLVGVGLVLLVLSLLLGRREDPRTRYRRDRWSWVEAGVVATGLVPAVVALATGACDAAALTVPALPLQAPAVPWTVLAAVLVAGLAAVLAPPPPGAPVRQEAS